MASTGLPPGLVLYQEQGFSKPLKELLPVLPTNGSRHDILRSRILFSRLDEQDDILSLGSGLYGYSQFVNRLSMRRMSLPADVQGMQDEFILFNFCMNEWWTKGLEIIQFPMSRSNELQQDNLIPSSVPNMRGLQVFPADLDLNHVTSMNFQLNGCVETKESYLNVDANTNNQEFDHNLIHSATFLRNCVHLDGRFSSVGTVSDVKDLASVLEEFAITKGPTQWTKQRVLVPHFSWNKVMDLRDVHSSSKMLGTVTTSPLKSPEKEKLKSARKRKTKKAATERDIYRNNSLHAFETILSLMVDKKRNGKSMMNSLKKSGPELPLFLTHISASITGTGLAVMFSVLYKVACGSLPFCTSNVLTSGFGVGLFWLSWAVNRLRNTIVYISKNVSKMGFEEEAMMTRVDKSVKDIVFRAAALVAVLLLRFA